MFYKWCVQIQAIQDVKHRTCRSFLGASHQYAMTDSHLQHEENRQLCYKIAVLLRSGRIFCFRKFSDCVGPWSDVPCERSSLLDQQVQRRIAEVSVERRMTLPREI